MDLSNLENYRNWEIQRIMDEETEIRIAHKNEKIKKFIYENTGKRIETKEDLSKLTHHHFKIEQHDNGTEIIKIYELKDTEEL